MNLSRMLAVLAIGVGVVAGAAVAQTVFNNYTSLVGTELITDALNPTGGSFSTALMGKYVFKVNTTTVGALPACATGLKGVAYLVTDASSPTYGGTLTGSSTTLAIALCDGTNWVAH